MGMLANETFDSSAADVQGCRMPVKIKNTFIHLEQEPSGDSDDEVDLPFKSVSAPNLEMHYDEIAYEIACETPMSWPCHPRVVSFPCQSYEIIPGSSVEVTSEFCKCDLAQTPKVTFDLSPSFFGGDEVTFGFAPEDHGVQDAPCNSVSSRPSEASQATHREASARYEVKNTFVHIDTSSADDSELMLPMKSVSVPAMPASILSPDASPVGLTLTCLPGHCSLSSLETCDTDELSDFSLPTKSVSVGTSALPSAGAAAHSTGACKPCAWFWKPAGCRWGVECGHCHLCPEGELRRRKKERQTEMKELKASFSTC